MPGTLNVGGHDIITHSGDAGAGDVTVNVQDRLVLNSSGNVGIGTSSPFAKLVVNSTTSPAMGISGNSTISFDVSSSTLPSIIADGSSNYDLVVGAWGDVIINANHNNNSPQFIIFKEGATERMRISSSGSTVVFATYVDVITARNSVGANTSNSLYTGFHSSSGFSGGTLSYNVTTDGSVTNGSGNYTQLSDIKLKENIVDANSQWNDLKAVRVRNYNFKSETGHPTHTHIGVIAQELELVSPGLVTDLPDRDEDGNHLGTVTKTVKNSVLFMKAIKALQEAMERIESQQSQIDALTARIEALENA